MITSLLRELYAEIKEKSLGWLETDRMKFIPKFAIFDGIRLKQNSC
jgi:hypothetical protein